MVSVRGCCGGQGCDWGVGVRWCALCPRPTPTVGLPPPGVADLGHVPVPTTVPACRPQGPPHPAGSTHSTFCFHLSPSPSVCPSPARCPVDLLDQTRPSDTLAPGANRLDRWWDHPPVGPFIGGLCVQTALWILLSVAVRGSIRGAWRGAGVCLCALMRTRPRR